MERDFLMVPSNLHDLEAGLLAPVLELHSLQAASARL
jgi:hypothetical protein